MSFWPPVMRQKPRTVLLALLAIFVLVFLSGILLMAGRPLPRPPLPSPNGYDDFLKAAALVTGNVGDAPTLDHGQLSDLVSTNQECLRLVRLGLTRQCAQNGEASMTNVPGMMSELAGLKRLAQLLAAEGRLREMDARYADAAKSYVETIRFGNEMSRGGFIINRLVGVACEAIGDIPLSKIAPKLSPEEARLILMDLERINAEAVTWDEVRRNENRFTRYQLSKGFNPVVWGMNLWQHWRSIKRAEMRHQRLFAHLRLLTVELAVRCYQSEQGREPASLEQLVPQYLQGVPSDPFSGRPLIYRAQGAHWLLYSVGEDGFDDGGKPVSRSVSGMVTRGDIFYDSPF